MLSIILLQLLLSSSLASAVKELPHPDLVPLAAFRATADPGGAVLSSWDSSDPCSGTWLGVSCRDGRVARIVLHSLALRGSIDPLARLPRLALLALDNNSFSSPLHLLDPVLWRPHLKHLYLSRNLFSGPFPSKLLLLRHLHRLDLSSNLFSGPIPTEIGLLLPQHLLTLNISRNLLSGEIPAALAAFPASSFSLNPGLCGPPLPLLCADRTPIQEKNKTKRTVVAIIAITTAAISLIAAATGIMIYSKRRTGAEETTTREEETKEGKEMVYLEGCGGFTVDELMRGSAEMLGRGAVGSTYRVVLEGWQGEGVAVKRVRRDKGLLNTSSSGRKAEEGLLKEIGRWRHPNVVSLRAYYSSPIDLLLVYDYLPNGSLHSLLHGNRGPGRSAVEWNTRLNLAVEAARGLAFLHGASKSKLSHQHLTSTNILIDDEGNACISDFALLHLLPPPSSPSSSFRTTTPEQRRSADAQKADVYSFGVILIEILTGRTSGDGMMDLVKWVKRVVRDEWTAEVFDIELLRCREAEDEMVALLQVALLCLAKEPKDRPKMTVVHKMIQDIKGRSCRGGARGSHTPSSLNDHSYESSSPCISEDTPTLPSS